MRRGELCSGRKQQAPALTLTPIVRDLRTKEAEPKATCLALNPTPRRQDQEKTEAEMALKSRHAEAASRAENELQRMQYRMAAMEA